MREVFLPETYLRDTDRGDDERVGTAIELSLLVKALIAFVVAVHVVFVTVLDTDLSSVELLVEICIVVMAQTVALRRYLDE